jgi:hypothetical protein
MWKSIPVWARVAAVVLAVILIVAFVSRVLWIIGNSAVRGLLVVSILDGTAITWAFSELLHGWIHQTFDKTPSDRVRLPWMAFVVGIGERIILTLLVWRVARVGGNPAATNIVTAMVGWTALKLAAGWQREPTQDPKAQPQPSPAPAPRPGGAPAPVTSKDAPGLEVRARAFAGILGSMLSLFIGYLGGLIWAGGGRFWELSFWSQ